MTIFALAPDQIIAKTWSNGVRGVTLAHIARNKNVQQETKTNANAHSVQCMLRSM